MKKMSVIILMFLLSSCLVTAFEVCEKRIVYANPVDGVLSEQTCYECKESNNFFLCGDGFVYNSVGYKVVSVETLTNWYFSDNLALQVQSSIWFGMFV